MKKLIALVVLLIMMVQLTNAQKRNIIKPVGLMLDFAPVDLVSLLEVEELSVLNAGYTAGYERLLGSRLSVGLQFTKYFKISSSVNGYGYSGGYSGPQSIPGYTFSSGSYARTGYNIEYESRYYFREFDEDGVRSAYLGFVYQFASFTESFSDATYYSSNYTGPSLNRSYPDQTFSANRFGLRFGYAGSNAISSNFFAGINFNIPGQQNKEWNSVKNMQPLTIYGGWTFGIPF